MAIDKKNVVWYYKLPIVGEIQTLNLVTTMKKEDETMNKDSKRELTPDEIKRNENYEKEKAGLEQEGYKACDLTTSVVKANVMAVVIVLPIIIISAILYFLMNEQTFIEFISVATGSAFVFYIAALMLLAGGGDMFTTLQLLTFKTNEKKSTYIDHPYLVGLTAFVKE